MAELHSIHHMVSFLSDVHGDTCHIAPPVKIGDEPYQIALADAEKLARIDPAGYWIVGDAEPATPTQPDDDTSDASDEGGETDDEQPDETDTPAADGKPKRRRVKKD